MSSAESAKAEDTPRSAFAKKLATDPEFRNRYEQALRELREAARSELEAIAQSEMLTAEDFGIVINATTEDMWH